MLAQQIEALVQQAKAVKAATLPPASLNGGYQYQENQYHAFQGLRMVKNMKLTTDFYPQGLMTNIAVLKAEELHTKMYGNFNNADYDGALANLRWRRAVGVL